MQHQSQLMLYKVILNQKNTIVMKKNTLVRLKAIKYTSQVNCESKHCNLDVILNLLKAYMFC